MRNRRQREKGSALVEVALMMPWIAFLFVGVLDAGFYGYAAICTQNAARAVAINSARLGGDTSTACNVALAELSGLPNMGSVNSCAAAPVWVPTPLILDDGSTPACADCAGSGASPIAASKSIQASVTYQTLQMIPIPGVLRGQLTLTRLAEARIIE